MLRKVGFPLGIYHAKQHPRRSARRFPASQAQCLASCSVRSSWRRAFRCWAKTTRPGATTAGPPSSAQYSELKQIDRTNVTRLDVAWSYPTGATTDTLFPSSWTSGVCAREEQRHRRARRHDGKESGSTSTRPAPRQSRTAASITGKARTAPSAACSMPPTKSCAPSTPRPASSITTFGDDGNVDLRKGLGRDPASSPPCNRSRPARVRGSADPRLGDQQGYGSAPGDMRAFDVRTGKLVWTFHTIPHPGEFGYETWPNEAWKTVGGANIWTRISVDVGRGIVYLPVASAKYNFYGADRAAPICSATPCSRSTPAPASGFGIFRFVHHDIWDYDPATSPKLLTVATRARRSTSWRKSPSRASSSSSTGSPESRSGRSRSGRCRRDATCRAKRPGRRSRSPPSRRPLRGRGSRSRI